MNIAVNYGARGAATPPIAVASFARIHTSAITFKLGLTTKTQWICPRCKGDSLNWQRYLSTSIRRFDETRRPNIEAKSPIEQIATEDQPSTTTSASLPSTRDRTRWQVSKRMARMMDRLLARASIAGQHINIYTGTDYSAIDALRKEIDVQEQKVKNTHGDIDTARATHHEAHAKQAASQKEIVSLLERKSSWSPEDLERYMSLVRSEHTDEQAVQTAKEGLRAAERDLENARAELERLERKQYHEEQIWSDTIRRNSTWVTFGLMGVNIVLLLAQITIFEPYRRRKIVRDVNQALEERTLVSTQSLVEAQIDEAIAPEGVPLEAVENESMPQQSMDTFVLTQGGASTTSTTSGHGLPQPAVLVSDSAESVSSQSNKKRSWSDRWEHYKERLQDLFSERIVQVKKVDMTTTALQGAATGVATMGLLFVLWRPK